MSDTPGKEISLTISIRNDSSSLSNNPRSYLTGDDGTREPATAEFVVSPVSDKGHLLIKVEGKEPLIVPVKQKKGALLVKTIGDIKQAWGVAINSKDQLIVVVGREGLEEEMPCKESPKKDIHKVGVGEVKERDKEDEFKGEEGMKVKKDKHQGDGDCILILSLEGEKIRSFGPKGNRDGEFNMPRGVAVDDKDNIYVVDKLNYRIQKFSPSGEHLASVGKKGHGPLEFDWPKAISIHPHTKNVYVTEANNHRVQILKPDLTFIHMFGAVDKDGKPRMGRESGEFNIPLGVAFDKAGRVYITDGPNDRIQVFTEGGEFIGRFGNKGADHQLRFPSVVCIDENDILYVTEVDSHRISVFEITKTLVHPRPRTQSLPAFSEAYTPPRFLTTFGKKSDHDPFYYGGIAVGKQGVVYVTDSCNDELQMFMI